MKVGMISDLRALRGDAVLEQEMKDHIVGRLKGNEIFLGHMTVNVLRFKVPLGWFGRIKTEAGDDHKARLDLKKPASLPLPKGSRFWPFPRGFS